MTCGRIVRARNHRIYNPRTWEDGNTEDHEFKIILDHTAGLYLKNKDSKWHVIRVAVKNFRHYQLAVQEISEVLQKAYPETTLIILIKCHQQSQLLILSSDHEHLLSGYLKFL